MRLRVVNPFRFIVSIIVLIAVLVFLFFAGLPAIFKSEIEKRAEALPEGEQLIGNEITGTMAVPAEWKVVGVGSETSALQYTDPDGSMVITLNASTGKKSYNINNAKASAIRAANDLQESGAVGITSSAVQLSETEAIQVYGYFGEIDDARIIWLLADEKGILHYISADGPLDAVKTAADMIESTYKFV